MTRLEVINPAALGAPRGYSNGILAPAGGRLLFVAGQIGWDGDQRLVSEDFVAQFDQALGNVVTVVREAGGAPDAIARLTLYVTDKQAYLAALRQIGECYRRHMGRHFPTMALVEVADLLEAGAQVEIEATAVIA
ncbi:MAG: RidA family protein [Acidobacteriota bacterium]